jgi:ribonuclease BN (tRNA processing enzyme)
MKSLIMGFCAPNGLDRPPFFHDAWLTMKLHCLGTAGYHPNRTRHTSSFFLREASILLDAGTGVFRLEEWIHANEISILLSHSHLDHVVGLTYFLDLVAITPLERIHVYGEDRKLKAIEQHLFHREIFPVLPPITWHPIDSLSSPWQLGQASVTWFPLEHPGGSVGYRLQFPEFSLAYVTDTTSRMNSDYWQAIQGVDWLIHECNFQDHQWELAEKTGHSWCSAVLENCASYGIQRLILMHINPMAVGCDPVGLAAATARLGNRAPPQIHITDDSTIIDLSSL